MRDRIEIMGEGGQLRLIDLRQIGVSGQVPSNALVDVFNRTFLPG